MSSIRNSQPRNEKNYIKYQEPFSVLDNGDGSISVVFGKLIYEGFQYFSTDIPSETEGEPDDDTFKVIGPLIDYTPPLTEDMDTGAYSIPEVIEPQDDESSGGGEGEEDTDKIEPVAGDYIYLKGDLTISPPSFQIVKDERGLNDIPNPEKGIGIAVWIPLARIISKEDLVDVNGNDFINLSIYQIYKGDIVLNSSSGDECKELKVIVSQNNITQNNGQINNTNPVLAEQEDITEETKVWFCADYEPNKETQNIGGQDYHFMEEGGAFSNMEFIISSTEPQSAQPDVDLNTGNVTDGKAVLLWAVIDFDQEENKASLNYSLCGNFQLDYCNGQFRLHPL